MKLQSNLVDFDGLTNPQSNVKSNAKTSGGVELYTGMDSDDHGEVVANKTIYTRAHSLSSAGRLQSAKARRGDPQTSLDLLSEFRRHTLLSNSDPTALISVSDRIVDTVRRAFERCYNDDEHPMDIWITFIGVPSAMRTSATAFQIYSAKELAEKSGHPIPNVFCHEFLFEWAIPNELILHEVSLQTLLDRKIPESYFVDMTTERTLPTVDVRRGMATQFECRKAGYGPWDIGFSLGFFVRCFGARAPVEWIALQLFKDCVLFRYIPPLDKLRLFFANGHTEDVDAAYIHELESGIDASLYEYWFADMDFYVALQEFNEEKAMMKEEMRCIAADFEETWHLDPIPEHMKARYEKQRRKLLADQKNQSRAIEAHAIKIGLWQS